MNQNIKDFLAESNAIEGVFDEDSLNQAFYAWEYLKRQEELSVSVILKTHKILMLHQPLRPDQIGYFRQCAVWIGGREGIHYSQISSAIKSWCVDAMTSIEVPGDDGSNIKIDHIEYERIHPFIDGNGRTGRMFMNWQREKSGFPILVIKNSEKQSYYRWFREMGKL